MGGTPDPLDLAARALRYRDRSRRQIDDRLERAGVEEAARDAALETLERVGYLDDRRFAHGRARALSEREYGDEAIRALLERDGATREAIEESIAALPPERERAVRVVARLGASARTAAHLQRKGFGEDAVELAGGDGFADEGPEA